MRARSGGIARRTPRAHPRAAPLRPSSRRRSGSGLAPGPRLDALIGERIEQKLRAPAPGWALP
ncbi:MAG: hypothetical protein ACYCYH_15370, partial [Steroidobacteraceae bacterium]